MQISLLHLYIIYNSHFFPLSLTKYANLLHLYTYILYIIPTVMSSSSYFPIKMCLLLNEFVNEMECETGFRLLLISICSLSSLQTMSITLPFEMRMRSATRSPLQPRPDLFTRQCSRWFCSSLCKVVIYILRLFLHALCVLIL